MLKGKLYRINKIEKTPKDGESPAIRRFCVTLSLDGNHGIFKGHFPGNPVLPGVCQVEIVRELAGEILERKLLLSQAGQVKYLSLINPVKDPRLLVNLKFTDIGPDEFDVSAEINSGDSVFMKMKGRLLSEKPDGNYK